ncbi:hypothetical protein FSP39_004944 [Pinctada imbricata]|uniref:Uncharacterized protein n=1 Tax=Pinctada imbricata TaxID=66713 RepID=A0AA89C5H6_PINIB|nr:hypothetical protein FSP39_004944 [Pinctada imbricata]
MAVLLTLVGIIVTCIICYYIFRYLDEKWREGRITNIVNRYVLVTGCDSGFGNAIAKQLDKLGVRVFASCLTEKGEKDIKSAGSSRMITLRLDVTDHEAISKAVQFVKKTLPADGVYVTKAFLPLLRKSRGRVVTISSDCGFITWPGRSSYCISKHGVESFTDAIRREMYHVGIKASTVQPGAFKTSIVSPEGMDAQLKRAWDKSDEEVKDYYGNGFYQECKVPSVQDHDISPVINAVEHALFSVNPKRRYLAGKDINGWIHPISLLPVWILDWYIAMTPPDKAKN